MDSINSSIKKPKKQSKKSKKTLKKKKKTKKSKKPKKEKENQLADTLNSLLFTPYATQVLEDIAKLRKSRRKKEYGSNIKQSLEYSMKYAQDQPKYRRGERLE